MILSLRKGNPISVNSGMDSDNFPNKMSSTLEFVRVLNRSGRRAEMRKVDWASPYKQIRVREEDIWQ